MPADTQKRSLVREPVFMAGVLLTCGVLAGFLWIMLAWPVCDAGVTCPSHWDNLKRAGINEIGDTFAGFAGTLTLIWLIVTVCLQISELREQRVEFRVMSDAMAEQASLLAREEKRRKQVETRSMVDELLKGLRSGIPQDDFTPLIWKTGPEDSEVCFNYGLDKEKHGVTTQELNTEDFFTRCYFAMNKYCLQKLESNAITKTPPRKNLIAELLQCVEEVLALEPDLSDDRKRFIDRCKMKEWQHLLTRLHEGPFWADAQRRN